MTLARMYALKHCVHSFEVPGTVALLGWVSKRSWWGVVFSEEKGRLIIQYCGACSRRSMSTCSQGTTLTGRDVWELTESCDCCARPSFVAHQRLAGVVPLANAILPVTL